ncbi:MAG: ParB/RepB/Spo0J family partition protein [Planctomycetaceae bacterium]|jgi:ParB family chromosome partitioning protein|nr:ParB/RepB/Spo0J family partition protein [Planctomycetaceae bacterium]
MTRVAKRLGRGLEALIGNIGENDSAMTVRTDSDYSSSSGIYDSSIRQTSPMIVDVMLIDRNPYQPRLEFDRTELDTLAASIINNGLLQPIVVRRVGERYQLIAGERRLRATIRAGLSEIAVVIKEIDERQMSELALVENLQRVDLNAIEKAQAFSRYIQTYNATHDEVAKRLDLDRSTITNLLRLLELPEELQMYVRKGAISSGHARAILPLKEHEDKLIVAERIINEGWSVRTTEKFVKELTESGEQAADTGITPDEKRTRTSEVSPHLAALEQEFRNYLGTKVKLSHNNGKGKIVIPFATHEDFERLKKMICK